MSEENSQSSAEMTQPTAAEAAPAPAPAPEAAAPSAETTAPAPAADDNLLAEPGSREPEGKLTDQRLPDTLGAPEAYDYKDVKLDDGVTLGKDTVAAFSEVAKELNLSQKSASAIVSKVAPAMVREQQRQVQELRSKWISEVRSDRSIDWERNGADINRMYKSITTPALRELFKRTGLDCNPEVIRMIKVYSDRISQDSFEKGAAGAKQTISAKAFYNRSNMND